MQQQAKFSIGEVISHKLFRYRGVIVDVDPWCMASDEWYEEQARSRPRKDAPWYHVLVDGAIHRTYVAEQNLGHDESAEPIQHPELDVLFESFDQGCYVPRQRSN